MNLFFNKPKLTTVLTHLLTFTSWSFPETHFPASFKTIRSIYACKLVGFAPSSLRTTRVSLVLHNCQSVPTNKLISKINIYGNSFPNRTILCMHMYISSKVTHAKYAVAETRISGVKWITVIHVLRNLRPLLTMYFRIEFQDFKLVLNV